jgi:hypothetical protein
LGYGPEANRYQPGIHNDGEQGQLQNDYVQSDHVSRASGCCGYSRFPSERRCLALSASRLTNAAAQIKAFNTSTQHVITTVEDFRATPETSAQVRSMGGIGDKPPAVISAGQQSSSWLEMQDELAALSSESIRRVVDGATHESLLYDKRDSQVTSAAIEQVIDAGRTDRPLIR